METYSPHSEKFDLAPRGPRMTSGRLWSSSLFCGALSAILVAAALAAALAMNRCIGAPSFPTTFFLWAMATPGWFGGFGPGILATILSFPVTDHFLTPSLCSIAFSFNQIPRVAAWGVAGWVVSWLGGGQKRVAAALVRAGDAWQGRMRERAPEIRVANDKLRPEAGERIRAEQELQRVNRALRICAACNQAVSRDADESELRLRAGLLQHLPVSAWTLKPDGTPDFVNRVWLEFAGQTLDFVRSHPEAWMTAIHPEDREMATRIFWEGVHSGQGFAFETRSLRARDGTYRWHLQQAVALRDTEGKVLKFVGTTTDIDDQKRTEEALRQAQAELAHVTRVTTMGELSASIAHEINQPIAGVVINGNSCLRRLARVTESSVEIDEARETLQRIIRDGNRAGEIVARIRALFKKTELAKEPLDLNETIREIIVLAKSEMNKQRVTLRLELSSELPNVLGDRVQLQQVLLNLILNAIDAMATVQDRARELVIRTQRRGEREVLATVRDTGIGLSAESIGQVFRAFHTTKPGGLGMGLSISRSIVENHSGRLWVAAHDGPGASFCFTVPSHPSRSEPEVQPGTI